MLSDPQHSQPPTPLHAHALSPAVTKAPRPPPVGDRMEEAYLYALLNVMPTTAAPEPMEADEHGRKAAAEASRSSGGIEPYPMAHVHEDDGFVQQLLEETESLLAEVQDEQQRVEDAMAPYCEEPWERTVGSETAAGEPVVEHAPEPMVDDDGEKGMADVDESEKEPSVGEDTDDDDDALQDELELLQTEAEYLIKQRQFLEKRLKRRARVQALAQQDEGETETRSPRRERRRKRRSETSKISAEDAEQLAQSTRNHHLLQELVAQQQFAIDNMRAMLAFAPVNDVRLALMTPLESYIHLGKDFNERRETMLRLRDEKLDTAFKYIEQKSQGLNLGLPYQFSDRFERFGKVYWVHFSLARFDHISVQDVMDVIQEHIHGQDDSLAQSLGYLTIREPYDDLGSNYTHQRIVSCLQWTEPILGETPVVESNSVFFARSDGDQAVLVVDYIDRDDLYPYQTDNRIRKDASTGMVLQSHVDANGVPCVVIKRFVLAKYHFLHSKTSKHIQDVIFSRMPYVSERVMNYIGHKLRLRSRPMCPTPSFRHSSS